MSPKPTLIFVPGAWHPASIWDKVSSLLKAQGYNCIAITLPTTTSDPSKTFSDDFQAVRNAIKTETAQGRNVVVVVHSYGGAVGVSAVKDLTAAKGNTSTITSDPTGHVIGICSMASGFGPAGKTFMDALGGAPPNSWKLDYESGFAVLVGDPSESFYHDLPEEERKYWVSKLLDQSLKALTEGAEDTYAGWMDVPVWYLATTEDRALPFQAQQYFVQTVKDAGGNITVREVESGHSPMLSKPKETADFISEAVTAFVG
ncbi:alpha/beta-hydrolase [Mollisia scopiformis]|uniref:Alpha/beta-hydrolase n=1 Tax=Mollisia scopiformis TaxID=149040 RepID=A0A194WZ34_MOLSC|nr:alpha/beta-hydrolase [Mollisia scopiformis]KUJ12964.1 alpha/beta-hydrolase [Mollisia scopiformis]